MTMREKIAREICREKCAFYGDPPCWSVEEGEWPNPDCDEPGCHYLADAALSAMREPTPEMAEAGCRATLPYDEGDAARAYRAMIDAAIQEKGE